MKSSIENVFWSSSYDISNGQAIVTSRVANADYGVRWRKAIYSPGIKSFFGLFGNIFILLHSIVFRGCRMVYVVCSRSIFGFLRDVPALMVAHFGVRVVVHAHGSDLFDLFKKPIIGFFARALYNKCEIIIPSDHLVKSISGLVSSRIRLVENFARPITAKFENGSNEFFHILWNSNLMASKGIKELVEGAKIARSSGVPLFLTILGYPVGDRVASLNEMKNYRDELSSIEWIDMKGSVSSTLAELAIVNANLVALPSYYSSECQPLAIIQAMCAGKKIIIADSPALRATVGLYPGRFVQPNAEEIAVAIIEEFNSPEINSTAVYQAVLRFDPKVFDAKMYKIFTE